MPLPNRDPELSYLVRNTASAFATSALIALSACGGDANAPAPIERTTVSDSAGIQIVTSVIDALARRSAAADPVFSIGSLEGGDDALFNVQAVDRFSTGEWVIANAGTSQLRIFSADGSFLRAFGGEGEGPGEFQNLLQASVFGDDSVFAYDFRSRRVSIFTSAGDFVRSLSPAEPGSAPFGMMGNGNVVASGISSFGGDLQSGTVVRPRTTGALLNGEGGLIRLLDEFGGREQFFLQTETSISIRSVPFSKTSRMAASGDLIFSGATENPEIRVRDDQGELRAIWRLAFTPPLVTPVEWDAERADELERADDQGAVRSIEDFYNDVPPPERRPAWGEILVSEEGELWLQQFSASTAEPSNIWWHFGPDGGLVEEVSLPIGFEPEWISGDLVVGTWEDDFEVEYVRGYRLGG